MKAYSPGLHERVAATYAGVERTQAQVATQLQVSYSFVAKLLRRQRLTATTAAKPASGGAPLLLTADHQAHPAAQRDYPAGQRG